MLKRRDSGAGAGSGLHQRRSVSFVDRSERRQTSTAVGPLPPSASTTSVPPPMLGQAASMMAIGGGNSSRFFGVSARGAKLTRPLSTTADLGVVFTVGV